MDKLRDRSMKCHRKLKEMKSGSGAKKIRKCDFYDEMLFLTKIITRRDTESNIPETTNVAKSPIEHTPIAKKKKQDVSEVDKNMAEFIKTVTKEEESRAMSFFKSIAPSVDKFSDEEIVDFQFEVLKLVRATQPRKASDVQHQWRHEYYKTTQPSKSSFKVCGPSYSTRPGYSTQKSTSIEFETETISSVETSHTDEFHINYSKEYEHLESVEFGNMMRTYRRKTTRCSYTTEDLKNAAKAVNDEDKSVNAAAKEFGIKWMTLTRFLKKINEGGDSSMGYAKPRQVFSPTQEDSLKKYLLQMESIFYGYSPKDVRRLAYECAAKFGIEIPPSWTANKMAGKE
ncbi:hypothetical protein KGM_200654 [Danaus plexippus plexippus]|uniref:HTH psq-type domain-containing protein n=1 Tax=Danaus plexippus plexippus TaxID=278856 RepID=A0A212FJF9_DANPL|nr:hypothetical protein KGM_200654 [Danaus plexippus plexippus]